MKKTIAIVIGIVTFVMFALFVFAFDDIQREEIAPFVFRYYTENDLLSEETSGVEHIRYDNPDTRTFRVHLIFEYGLSDLVCVIGYDFPYGSYDDLDSIISTFPEKFDGRIYDLGALRSGHNSNYIPIQIDKLSLIYERYGFNDTQYNIVGIDDFRVYLNTRNVLGAFVVCGETIYFTFTDFTPDFSDNDFWGDTVVDVLRILILPIISLFALLKGIFTFFAFFGGGFLV